MCEVVITGAGVVSPIGTGLAQFKQAMFASESGAVNIRGRLVGANFPVPAAAPVLKPPELPEILREREPGSIPHAVHLAASAAAEAMQFLPRGLLVTAVVHGGHAAAHPATFPGFPDASGNCPEWHSALDLIRYMLEQRQHGPLDDRNLISLNNVTVSSNQAIGLAFQRIRSGVWERAVVSAAYGNCCARDLMNFHLLGTLTTGEGPAVRASRPFSRTRSGFVLGEGAAALVLENRRAAEERGATILGAISGYGSTSDAYRITDGRSDVAGAATAMRKAVRDAGLTSSQISAVSAHGTSTRMNDRLETKAIKEALGQVAHRVPVISLKSQIGHCLAAAGALEAIACLLMFAEQRFAPTINCNESDPECDLDYVPNFARSGQVERILSNNFGFGGQNSCVVFERVAPAESAYIS